MLRVAWEGSQFVYHSLAHVNRELCLGLIDSGEVDLSIIPYERHQFEADVNPRFAALAERTVATPPAPPAVHVRHQWPPNFTPPADGAWVMIQPWEFGGLPAEWVAPMRDLVDEIWVPSTWVRECYVRSGVPADKVVVIPNGVDPDRHRPEGPRFALKSRKRFKFLFLGGTIGRKGIDILLETYVRTFSAADDVCLVIKAASGDTAYRNSSIAGILEQIAVSPDAPEIELISDNLSDDDIAALYRACDALVQPYRGEGFGMPIAEAMATALPVIVTGYGACLDFCDSETALLIPAREFAVPDEGAALPPSSVGYWLAEPDRAAFATLMLKVVADPVAASEIGLRARARVVERLSWPRIGEQVRARLRALAQRSPLRQRLEPLRLEGRRRVAFLHTPDWHHSSWREVVDSYARAFTPSDDVTLVLWLDPRQGVSSRQAAADISAVLDEVGVDPDQVADLLLVPDQLNDVDVRRLYASVDCVVAPANAELAKGKPRLEKLSRVAWRTAAGLAA